MGNREYGKMEAYKPTVEGIKKGNEILRRAIIGTVVVFVFIGIVLLFS